MISGPKGSNEGGVEPKGFWIVGLLALGFGLARANTYTVINTADADSGSLRWVITQANSHAGPDTIAFNIPTTDPGYQTSDGSSWWQIEPTSALPELTDDSTFIDGVTQTTNQGNTNPKGPEIELTGVSAGGGVNGLSSTSAHNRIQDLVIKRFSGYGIRFAGTGAHHNTVTGCYIGTDVTGEEDRGNSDSGIALLNGAGSNTIGGTTSAERNLISGNDYHGILISGSGTNSNYVIGNYTGVDRNGTAALSSVRNGIHIDRRARSNIIGRGTQHHIGQSPIWSAHQRHRYNQQLGHKQLHRHRPHYAKDPVSVPLAPSDSSYPTCLRRQAGLASGGLTEAGIIVNFLEERR